MTTIYFVRHAQPNYQNHDDLSRELTEKGLIDSIKVTDFLKDKKVQAVYSSPFKRAQDTLKDFTESVNLPMELLDDFRERKIDSVWIDDFEQFSYRQWTDFSFKLKDGESLAEVQERNIKALNNLLEQHPHDVLAISSHGTALSTIVNYYQPNFTISDFQKIKHLFPFIIQFNFERDRCTSITLYDILQEPIHETSLL